MTDAAPTATSTPPVAPAPRYVLDRTPPVPVEVPVLDPSQQAVVDHAAGPLLVLAGPGTGKTTTLVESVVARVESGTPIERVLVLTFSRKAADELRGRITVRLGRTVAEPAAYTFHGFCHAVLRGYGVAPGGRPPRLLSGAEREVRVRELLRGNAEGEGQTRWPADLRPALTLRGFAREVADLLDRTRERGLDGAALRDLGRRHHKPAWVAAGGFLDEYLGVLDIREEIDYPGLIAGATALLHGAAVELTSTFDAVYVDEYQDTDPSQVRLLKLLAGNGRLLVAVGDPDQAIYAFRGAEVRNILEFPDVFPQADGAPARVLSLRVSRRTGRDLLEVSRAVARKIPLGALTSKRDEHRELDPAGPRASAAPEVRLFATVADEVAAIADIVRRAHLGDGVPWSEMAVLVRSGVRSIPVLRRALVAAGVPVAVAADEVPLARDPAVAPLLTALEIVEHGPQVLTPDTARLLLLSALGRATPAVLRALGRRLRALDRAAGAAIPRPSSVLIRDAVLDPRDLAAVDDWAAEPARRIAERLAEARRIAAAGGTPEAVLWSLYDGSGWGRRLARDSARGGAAGRSADRDLDAILGLFDAASRLEDRQPRAGVGALLEEIAAQEIPAGAYEERATATDAVRLLTAHRAKGLEWDLVVVSAVQEGVWPDVRRRGTLLEADAVDTDGIREPPSSGALLVEERRLFYVALTRARRRLVVTAVAAVDDEGERPSRFIEELGLPIPDDVLAGTDLLAPASLVARLRRTLAAAGTSDGLRATAAQLLGRLADAAADDGTPLIPAADPQTWWGLRELTPGVLPVRPADERVALSGSAVASFERCPRAWFLDREAHAQGATSSSQGFGSVVHALAEAVGTGELEADATVLLARLDEVWGSLPFDAPWQATRERAAAEEAITRFLAWHATNERTLIDTEVGFRVEVADDVVLRGRADRLEYDDQKRVVVVDLKTSKYPPQDQKLKEEPQLGVYQLAVREGAFEDVAPGEPGGAELVQLRKSKYGKVKVQSQPALGPADTWAADLVHQVAAAVRAEQFPARVNDLCDRCDYRTSCPASEAGQQVVE